jgi:hypothetical protein
MPRYEWLQDDERNNRRSIADAIDILHSKAGFDDAQTGTIRVGGLRLPSNEIVGLISVLFESPANDTIFIVALRTAKQFRAKRQGGEELEGFPIVQLDGASFDHSGMVQLPDGMRLRAVDLIPALLPYEITDLDWCIVHHTIAFMKAEPECYRYPIHFERSSDALDCSALIGLQGRVPGLKQIQGYIADREPALSGLSQQQIANTLCKFGMRIPARRASSPRRIPPANN